MKRKLLSYLLILALLFCGLPAKTGSAADYKYAVEGEDYVLNVFSKFNAPHYINGYCFSNMSYYERHGQTYQRYGTLVLRMVFRAAAAILINVQKALDKYLQVW